MTSPNFMPQLTKDGSYTFFSDEFQEAFHSIHGAKQEAEIKFVQPTLIRKIAQERNSIRILDICYGLGYNSAAAMEAIWQVNPQCHIDLVGLEISAEVPQQAFANKLLNQWRSPVPQFLAALAQTYLVNQDKFQGRLVLGDARQTIQQFTSWQADAIFLDPFSPPKCPQLWTVEFIAQVAQCLAPQGRLATYSCAAAVRTALLLAGLNIGSTKSVGRKSPGTVAAYVDQGLTTLSLQEQEHLRSRASIPYRDFYLSNSTQKIRELREQEQQNSKLEPTSQWKKRWLRLNS